MELERVLQRQIALLKGADDALQLLKPIFKSAGRSAGFVRNLWLVCRAFWHRASIPEATISGSRIQSDRIGREGGYAPVGVAVFKTVGRLLCKLR